ncbi:unnamed protein product, partial [Meganyctiphanes norvegica]
VDNAEMAPPTPGGASTIAPGTDYAQTPHSTFGDSHDMQNFQTPEHFQTPHHDPAHGAHAHDPAYAELQKFPDFEPPKVDDPHEPPEPVDEPPKVDEQNAAGAAPAANTSYEESSHPPPTTPGAQSDGGPKSVYAEAPHSPPPATPAPQTPGPVQADQEEEQSEMPPEEEQAEDETYEEYEERVVNKRAGLMFHQIKKRLRNDTINFGKMVHGHNRKQVAQKFYTMLVLKKLQAVELDQDDPFGELTIKQGTLFENASL